MRCVLEALSERRSGSRLVGLAAVVLFSACATVGPDFKRPPAPSWLTDWKGGSLESLAEDPRVPRGPITPDVWWRAFDDPVLDHLIAEAQRVNPNVLVAGLRIMEARAQLGIAGSALYPQSKRYGRRPVVGRAAAQRERHQRGFGERRGQAGWELDFWGKFRRGIESADASYFASIAQYDDLQVLMAAQVASLYCSIRTGEARLAIARENADLQKRSLEITERLFKGGDESELDVQQATAQYLGTLATSKASRKTREAQLSDRQGGSP